MSSEDIKIVIVGESKVGKTSVIEQFNYGKLYPEGAKNELKVYKNMKTDLHIIEINTNKENTDIIKLFAKGAKAFILIYDITNENSFKELKNWYDILKEFGVPFYVVANKNDLEDKKVKDEDAKEFAESFLDTENSEGGTIGVAATGADAEAKQVEPHDYVPNAMAMNSVNKRLMAYFGTNEKIVSSTYNEDEWNAYYENVVEPFAQALAEEFTRKIFSRAERARGNRIAMDSTSLQYASMASKLNLVQMVDRGALTPNEWRQILNLAPIEGGDKPIRRLDTQVIKEGGSK